MHSIYLANKLNDHVLRGVAYVQPTTVAIGLFTSSTGLNENTSGTWTEASGGSYARLTIDGTILTFSASADKLSSNEQDWEFVKATAAWGIITHAAVLDSATAGLGNVLYWGGLTLARDIQIDDIFRFLAGDFDSLYA